MLSEFPTTPMEMKAVADHFDDDGDGYIDYKAFVSALKPDRGEVVTKHTVTIIIFRKI